MSTLSDVNDVIVKLQVTIAIVGEQIIALKRSNKDLEKGLCVLRKEQETRFRWTIYTFVALLLAFLGIAQLIYRIPI